MDAILGDLEQVLAVEGRAGRADDIDRALDLAVARVERVDIIARGEPEMRSVKGHAGHALGAGEGTIFTDDLSG